MKSQGREPEREGVPQPGGVVHIQHQVVRMMMMTMMAMIAMMMIMIMTVFQRWGSITEGMLRQLLSSTRLRIVNLQLVNSLTDELFKVKFKMHQQKYKMHQHIFI